MINYRDYKDYGYEPVQPCKKCGTNCDPSLHHVFPQAFYKSDELGEMSVWLCRTCHNHLERLIYKYEKTKGVGAHHERRKLPRWYYPFILVEFLTQKPED
jgi:hypothetical protein